MAWPKGRPRPKKVGKGPHVAPEDVVDADDIEPVAVERAPDEPPADWRKGALLNVRNRGDAYVITLYPEEYSDEHPERAIRFTNLGRCQDFVSAWYSRESHDPRAR